MKKPSVRSRCGSVCRYCGMVGCFQTGSVGAQVVDGEVLVSGQEALPRRCSFSTGEIVQVE